VNRLPLNDFDVEPLADRASSVSALQADYEAAREAADGCVPRGQQLERERVDLARERAELILKRNQLRLQLKAGPGPKREAKLRRAEAEVEAAERDLAARLERAVSEQAALMESWKRHQSTMRELWRKIADLRIQKGEVSS
jgi:hypothetical protein